MNFYLQNTEINLRKAEIYNFFKRKNRKKLIVKSDLSL